MSGRAFVDTNVLVYLFDKRDAAKTAAAHSLVGRDDLTFCTSAQVLSEFYVTVTRKVGVPPEVAAATVQLYRRLEVVPVDADLVAEAIGLSGKSQISLWDAQIVCAAVRADCTTLNTEDLNDGQVIAGVTVVNPFVG